MCQKQQGALFIFGTSVGTWKIVSIGRYSEPIPVLDDSHLATTVRRTKCPGTLGDPQMLTIVVQADSDQAWPAKGLLQTGTIQSPASGFTNEEELAGTGFVVDVRSAEFASDTEAIQTIEFDWQFDGKTGPARTLAS